LTRELDLANWRSIPEETLLTVSEAAGILRMSESKVRLAIKNNMLEHYRPTTETGSNGDIRIMMTDLVEYLESSRGKPKSSEEKNASRQKAGKPLKHVQANWVDGTSSRKGRNRSPSGTGKGSSLHKDKTSEARR
jgi:excisionase family DNA binding protein